jgi:uncharacterized protein YhjY with autotransporter beta-barrel domain
MKHFLKRTLLAKVFLLNALFTATSISQVLDMDGTPAITQPTLADIKDSGNVFFELFTTGKLSSYDGIRYFHNLQDEFYIHNSIVESVVDSNYQAFQNFYVEGTDSSTDVFTLSALQISPGNPDPNINPYQYYLRTLNLDNIHLKVDANGSAAQPVLLIYDQINLNSSKLTFGSNNKLYWMDDHEINVSGTGNVIAIPTSIWVNPVNSTTSLNISAGADFTIENFSGIYNERYGNLTMGAGSSFIIDKSEVVLTSEISNANFKASTIDNATISINGSGLFSPANLQITNPIIRNSTITLGNNNVFRAYQRSPIGVTTTAGSVTFEGNNTINLGDGALFIGQHKNPINSAAYGSFDFNNGTTTVNGTTGAKFQASSWFIDNATVNLNTDEAETFVSTLSIKNSIYQGREIDFDNVSSLSLANSTVTGQVNFGNDSASAWVNNSSIINPGLKTQSGGTEQYAIGQTFNFGAAFWVNNNTFISNIDPLGTEALAGSSLTKSYANLLFIKRAQITGFGNLNIELNTVDNSLIANDYASGGAASDGVYDLVDLDDGATADSDTPTITLGSNMPALLSYTQVKTPSADDQVSIKLIDTGYTGLVQNPNVQTNNQKGAASLVGNGANNGNAQLQNSLNSITNAQLQSQIDNLHPEPYSSYITVSLEHSDMVMNTVLSHAASSEHFSTGRTNEVEEQQTNKRFWMDAGYSEGDVDGGSGLGGFDYNLSSLTMGQDLTSSGDQVIGIYASFGKQEMDEHENGSQNFSGDVYHVGMYLNQSNVEGWDISGLLGYAYGDHESKRHVTLGTSSESVTADYKSHSAYIGVRASRPVYKNNWITLSPELGFNYIYYSQESFRESGDPSLSLEVDRADAQAVIASAGLNARLASLSNTVSIYPLAFVRYEHDFYADANNEHEIEAALVAHPDHKQTFIGQNRGEHAIITGIGLGSDLTSALQVSGGLIHSENSNGSEWGAGLNLKYYW